MYTNSRTEGFSRFDDFFLSTIHGPIVIVTYCVCHSKQYITTEKADNDVNDDDDDDDDDGDDDDDDQEEGVRRRVGSISLAGITGPEELELLEEEAHCESEVIFFLFFYLSLMILKL